MKRNEMILRVMAACGTAAGITCAADAQPYVINMSGATLLENWIKAPASTNDYFDVDGDGIARIFSTTDQLATSGLPPGTGQPYSPSQHWIVQYRVVGSVRGFQELVNYGKVYVSGTDNDPSGPRALDATKAYCNRTQYINNGVLFNPIYNPSHPGGAPVKSLTDGSHEAPSFVTPPNPMAGGIRIDLAPVDVASLWAVKGPASAAGGASGPAFDDLPGTIGYGRNPRLNTNKDGTVFVDGLGNNFGHQLADLGPLNLYDPNVPPDENTIFDTPVAWATIALVTNLGTGVRQMDQSDVRHLIATGRNMKGENFMVVTRDSGSGTRNAFNNSIGLDPSWGVGENIGGLSVLSNEHILGPNFIPGNKGGNSNVEVTARNHRLGIGYAGAERGIEGAWLSGGQLEIIAIRNDLQGGTEYSRPTIDDVLDNDANGYLQGGASIFASIGDPRSAPVEKGGDPGNTNPDMDNVEAAAFLNNLRLSTEAFIALPGGDETLFTPGELAATKLVLTAGLDYLPSTQDPLDLQVNPNFNQAVQDFIRANNVLANPLFDSFGQVTLNGKNPTRQTNVTYSDGVSGTATHYISQGGAPLTYGANTLNRNRIAGDFNGDAKRDINDATEMLKAFQDVNGGPAWVAPTGTGDIAGAPGSDACIEILGDFTGDGNFGRVFSAVTNGFDTDKTDIRYWADGLGVDPSTRLLDRRAAFTAVDTAWSSLTGGDDNFFDTVLATGATYEPGDSAADVSRESGLTTPGFVPVGADGTVNGYDIDYVYKQFKQNPGVTDGALNWENTAEAVTGDLSADVTGDRIIDQSDVCAIVFDILETTFGDVDLDGDSDAADITTALANVGNPGGWADGDVDGDGMVTTNDVDIITDQTDLCDATPCECKSGDADGDCDVDSVDLNIVLTSFPPSCHPTLGCPDGDVDGDGDTDSTDLNIVLTAFGCGVEP